MNNFSTKITIISHFSIESIISLTFNLLDLVLEKVWRVDTKMYDFFYYTCRITSAPLNLNTLELPSVRFITNRCNFGYFLINLNIYIYIDAWVCWNKIRNYILIITIKRIASISYPLCTDSHYCNAHRHAISRHNFWSTIHIHYRLLISIYITIIGVIRELIKAIPSMLE